MADDVRRPPSRSTWDRNRRVVVLALAAVTMAVEIASLVFRVGPSIGRVGLSLSLVPSLVLLLALGRRSNGRVADPSRLVPFWLGVGGAYLFGWVLWSRQGTETDIVALVFAALNEEVVYRFAVPLVLTTALLVVKVPTTAARVAGYVVAGGWWVLLPGHRAQVDAADTFLGFVAFAIISALVVSRSRALIPMGLAHGALNVITLSEVRGDIEPATRGVLTACLLLLLVGTFAWPGDRAKQPRRAEDAADGRIDDLVGDVVIDLRDDVRPSVRRDEVVTYLDDEPGAPAHQPADDGAPRVPGSARD